MKSVETASTLNTMLLIVTHVIKMIHGDIAFTTYLFMAFYGTENTSIIQLMRKLIYNTGDPFNYLRKKTNSDTFLNTKKYIIPML